MEKNNTVRFKEPEGTKDLLTEVIRNGARKLLQEAVEAEVELFMQCRNAEGASGPRRIVKNGHLPERAVQTGIGPVEVKVPRAKDRSGEGEHFKSKIVAPYARRSVSLDVVIPELYLRGLSTGDFTDALRALVGEEGFSASLISRLKAKWKDEREEWLKRDLTGKRYAYAWGDGVYLGARMADEKQCVLVLIGVNAEGEKELLGYQDGIRESTQSWSELLLDLKQHGLEKGPLVCTGDGAMGLWMALTKTCPETRHQRCWVHKEKNVLNQLPKSAHAHAKTLMKAIWMAATKAEANKNFEHFVSAYKAKYPKAAENLNKDRVALMTFYDFPAEHWQHIRTSNPVESTFATVRLRSAKTRGCLSQETVLTLVFKLCKNAEKHWNRIRSHQKLTALLEGAKYQDGLLITEIAA
jgi:putative transposase